MFWTVSFIFFCLIHVYGMSLVTFVKLFHRMYFIFTHSTCDFFVFMYLVNLMDKKPVPKRHCDSTMVMVLANQKHLCKWL